MGSRGAEGEPDPRRRPWRPLVAFTIGRVAGLVDAAGLMRVWLDVCGLFAAAGFAGDLALVEDEDDDDGADERGSVRGPGSVRVTTPEGSVLAFVFVESEISREDSDDDGDEEEEDGRVRETTTPGSVCVTTTPPRLVACAASCCSGVAGDPSPLLFTAPAPPPSSPLPTSMEDGPFLLLATAPPLSRLPINEAA